MDTQVGLLTVSDRSYIGQRPDLTGPAIREILSQHDWVICFEAIVPDDIRMIQDRLVEWSDSEQVNIIFTAGGTGFSPRDVTPEATLGVIDRLAPGIAEAMRSASLKITPHAMLSRAVAGIRGHTLIINLPGSPKGAVENLEVILPILAHAVQLLSNSPDAESGHQIS